jgi:acyl carrier protein
LNIHFRSLLPRGRADRTEIPVSNEASEQVADLTNGLTDAEVEVFREFRGVVANQLDVPEEKITSEARLVDDLGADSLQVIELALMLEEKFSIDLPDREMSHFRTVGSAMKRLLELIAEKKASAA